MTRFTQPDQSRRRPVRRPYVIDDRLSLRHLDEDDYYRTFAEPLPRPAYKLMKLAAFLAWAVRLPLKRHRPRQRPMPTPTGNCNRPASR